MDRAPLRPLADAPATASGAPPRARMAWVDVAKGACIVFVVLVHVTNLHVLRLHDADAVVRAAWEQLGKWLRPVRMPLFFLLSGLLAGPALQRRDPASLRLRIWRSYELYVAWMALQALLVDRWLRPDADATTPSGFLHALVMPTGALWYLWALAVYVLILSLTPARARGVLVAAGTVLWVLVSTKHWHLLPRPRDLLQYFAWFALGATFPAVVRGVVGWFTPARAAAALGAFVAGIAWLVPHGPNAAPVLQVLGVLAGLGVATQLRGPVADGLAHLGRRTLPIYVLHIPLLTIWGHALLAVGWRGAMPTSLTWLYPVALATAIIAISLTIERGIRRLGAGRLLGDRR